MSIPVRLHRSELCVPGTSERMLEKAPSLGADVVMLDLEDAVAPDDKPQARENVIAALRELDWSGCAVTVRINGLDTHYCYRDIVDVVEQSGRWVDTVLIPKAGCAGHVHHVATLLTQIEDAVGISNRIGISARGRSGAARGGQRGAGPPPGLGYPRDPHSDGGPRRAKRDRGLQRRPAADAGQQGAATGRLDRPVGRRRVQDLSAPNRAASSEPPVASPSEYAWAPAPASLPPSTIRYSSRIGRSPKWHSRISRVPAA